MKGAIRVISTLAWNLSLLRMNARKYWTEWDRFEMLDPASQQRILSERMFSTLEFFSKREESFLEWRELARSGSPVDVWKHWSSLPIVTKNDLRERFNADRLKTKYSVHGIINTSGGSTGTPTRFLWDSEAQIQKSALAYYCWTKMGWKVGMPVVSLWGSPRDLGQSDRFKTRFLRRLRNTSIIDGYEFNEETVERTLAALKPHSQVAMYGYTTLLEEFANRALEGEFAIPHGKIGTAWSGAEPLRDDQSEHFRDAFGVPIHNQYGGREFGAIGYKLAGRSSFRIFRPVLYLEIVNENNEPCEPGEVGRVLLTTLIGKGTPFIRYENGDLAKYYDSDRTKAGLVGMASVEGRTTSLIRLPGGRTFHSVFWHQLFKDYSEIRRFHVHQRSNGAIEATYVGDPMSEEARTSLNSLVERMLGDVKYSIERVDALPKTSQGKHLQVTSDYRPDN